MGSVSEIQVQLFTFAPNAEIFNKLQYLIKICLQYHVAVINDIPNCSIARPSYHSACLC
jgi:hypothetical protein